MRHNVQKHLRFMSRFDDIFSLIINMGKVSVVGCRCGYLEMTFIFFFNMDIICIIYPNNACCPSSEYVYLLSCLLAVKAISLN